MHFERNPTHFLVSISSPSVRSCFILSFSSYLHVSSGNIWFYFSSLICIFVRFLTRLERFLSVWRTREELLPKQGSKRKKSSHSSATHHYTQVFPCFLLSYIGKPEGKRKRTDGEEREKEINEEEICYKKFTSSIPFIPPSHSLKEHTFCLSAAAPWPLFLYSHSACLLLVPCSFLPSSLSWWSYPFLRVFFPLKLMVMMMWVGFWMDGCDSDSMKGERGEKKQIRERSK